GIQFDGRMCGKYACATAVVFFERAGMRCAVGAQKEFLTAAGRSFDQRLTMLFAFQDGQAVIMRADSALKNRVAVITQVMCGNGCCDGVRCGGDKVGGFLRGDMFEYHAQPGKTAGDRSEYSVDEAFLAVENID